jgi:hypothetical protein
LIKKIIKNSREITRLIKKNLDPNHYRRTKGISRF